MHCNGHDRLWKYQPKIFSIEEMITLSGRDLKVYKEESELVQQAPEDGLLPEEDF